MSGKQTQTIVARRTPDVEKLLQQLWSLRPELEDKNKVTIVLALAVLLRESQRMLSFSSLVSEDNNLGKVESFGIIDDAKKQKT